MKFRFLNIFSIAKLVLSLMSIGLWLSASAMAQDIADDIDLTMMPWVYHIGDDVSWKEADFDHTHWTPVTVPGGIPEKFPFFSENIVWFKTEFRLETATENKLLILGQIYETDEAYLNGRKIGSTGRIAKTLSDYSALPAANLPRYYGIDAEDLVPGRNVLTLRVQAIRYSPNIMGPELIIADGRFPAPTLGIPFTRIIIEMAFFTILGLGFCLSIWVWFRRPIPPRDKWLPCLFAALALGSLPYSVLLIPLGWDAPLLRKMADFVPYTIFALLYLAAVVGQTVTRLQWIAVGAIYIILIVMCMPVSISWINPLLTLLIIPMIVAYGIGVLNFFKTTRQGIRISVWVYLALALTFLIIFWEVGFAGQFTPNIDMAYWAIMVIAIALLMAMGDHNRWDAEKVQTLTQKLLNIREAEREDIARELHDGVNQRLAASRFRLERISSRHGDAVAGDLAVPIMELRETGYEIAGLVESFRPLLLNQGDFGDALTQFADRLNILGEIEVELNITGTTWPAKDTQSHLYRILQEAAYNAKRHGEATRLKITGLFTPKKQALIISDNGCGFDVNMVRSGVGLTAMQERSDLIGANIKINSESGKGTSITIKDWANG